MVISVVNDLFTNQIKHITWEQRLSDYMKVRPAPLHSGVVERVLFATQL